MVDTKAAQKPRHMRSCLSWMVNQTTSSECPCFAQRVEPGKPPKGTGCRQPVTDQAACNLQAGHPTSHNAGILLYAFYNINAEFSLNKHSLIQASVNLLYNTCRLVFLLAFEIHQMSFKEQFGAISQKHLSNPCKTWKGLSCSRNLTSSSIQCGNEARGGEYPI